MKKQVLLTLFALAFSLLLASTLGQTLSLAHPAPSDPSLAPAAPAVAWYSDWRDINQGETLTLHHSLGLPPERLWVELWFKDTNGHGGINRAGYGGIESKGSWYGAYWHHFTADSVQVTRLPNDKMADQILVRVREIKPPDYDSGWLDFPLGNTHLDHNLGITDTDLLAAIWFSGTVKGIHHYGYGSLTAGTDEYGAYWMRLTDNSIELYRRVHDEDAEQVRVLVTKPDPPDYDSLVALGDWQDVAPGSVFTFTHNLNWNPSLMTVRADCLDTAPGGQGINHNYAGGDIYNDSIATGYHTQNLTANSLHFVRRANDMSCDRVRVRIWKRQPPQRKIYLPLMMGGGAQNEQELAYDDGSGESSQSYTTGNGFAVRFTPPAGGAKLLRARYFFLAPVAPIQVHVWDDNHADLIAPFTATPAGDGWFDVDLSASNLTVDDDFYVGFLYTQDTDPTLGADTSSPDGRSYEVPWEVKSGLDYMIRAVVSPNS